MNKYQEQIITLEKNSRVALSCKYPVLLPLILETKRLIQAFGYTFNPKCSIEKKVSGKWVNLTEHSSPLFRKYNDRQLDEGKIKNIKIAIKLIDGLVIPSGKIFSFWKFVGRPSEKSGFAKGLLLSGGQLKEGVGGGLCQLSNLLAYMFASTECVFVERKHHSKDVFPDSGRTIPFASGATVFFNLIDLKIKNTYPFPIKINLRTTDTQLRGSISSPTSLDYFVKIEEKNPQFIKSVKTRNIYRCNELHRVFYTKIHKHLLKTQLLWVNVAEVMYAENESMSPVKIFDSSIKVL